MGTKETPFTTLLSQAKLSVVLADKVILLPSQILWSIPAFTVGLAFTVIKPVLVSLSLPPLAVAVRETSYVPEEVYM